MKTKLLQTSYFGFMSLLVIAPTARAALLPDDPTVKHSASIVRELNTEQAFLEMPFVVQKGDLDGNAIDRAPQSEPVINVVAKNRASVVATPRNVNSSKLPLAPITQSQEARILVVDAQALNSGMIVPVTGAVATWIGQESRLETKAAGNGVIKAPYPRTRAQRFIVNAEGFIPAVGYATMGSVAVAPMYRADLVKPLVESLALTNVDGHIVIGKALDKHLRPVANLKVDLSQSAAQMHYSMGELGIFMPELRESGTAGDFVATGLDGAIQYFMPVDTKNAEEWPATIVDLSDVPQVVSIALPKSEREFAKTTILDAVVSERPEGLVNVTIGAQRGLYFPEEDGETLLENFFVRPAMDTIEVRAPSYLKSWIHTPASLGMVPEFSPLLTEEQVQMILEPTEMTWNSTESLVVGAVRQADYAEPVEIRVMGPNGRLEKNAKVIYFDRDRRASVQTKSTAANDRFIVVGLEDGEWSLVATGAKTKRGLGATVVRTSGAQRSEEVVPNDASTVRDQAASSRKGTLSYVEI